MAEKIRYAGFFVRFIASLVDTFALALPIAVVIYILSEGAWFDVAQYQHNMQAAMGGNASLALNNPPKMSMRWELLFEFSVLLITLIFWKRWRGATPGKKFVHIKIVDAKTLQDITNTQALTRSFGYIASALSIVGFLLPLFRKDKRALHDLLASTAVIYDNTENS